MSFRNLVLELARSDDAEVLAQLSRDLIEAGLGWEYRRERLARLIGNSSHLALVAREGTRVAGFAVMEFGDERAHLVLLAVCPAHQRRGVGRRLVQWLVESAVVAGLASVHVELREANVAAHALYDQLGFEETSRTDGYYRGRETAIRMVRVLRAPGGARLTWSPPPRPEGSR
jgi:ribosomal protein S18 acetylase RimI-like enzyme